MRQLYSSWKMAALLAVAPLSLAATPAFALGRVPHGVPGPVAGAGLAYAAAAGGYYLFRRWRKKKSGQ
ncbi:MAG TPA: hypothetical protein VFG05_08410 [Methylocella sp.]|nr:hypothetical protein [Methylocella sp.]